MKKIVLAAKRHWNWRVFLVLVGLIIPATFAILPYLLNLQATYSETSVNASFGWEILVLDRLINSILPTVLLGGIGLAFANRIGLGMPFVERWVKREPSPYRFRNVLAIAWIAAVVLVLSSMFLHTVVFDPPLHAMLQKLGITIPQAAQTPPVYGFLAAISAGITEETLFRLFGLSLLAWLGGLLFHDPDGRPKPIVFWTANLLFALAFGVAHLPAQSNIGLPITPLVVTSTIVLNGIGGLVFGWLFCTFGLESAILAHILADIVRHSLIPFISMQQGETARYLAIAGVIVFILAALIWAFRALSRVRHWQFHAND
jgi:membrane protease YdiL (CAAX protease family)